MPCLLIVSLGTRNKKQTIFFFSLTVQVGQKDLYVTEKGQSHYSGGYHCMRRKVNGKPYLYQFGDYILTSLVHVLALYLLGMGQNTIALEKLGVRPPASAKHTPVKHSTTHPREEHYILQGCTGSM